MEHMYPDSNLGTLLNYQLNIVVKRSNELLCRGHFVRQLSSLTEYTNSRYTVTPASCTFAEQAMVLAKLEMLD